MHPRPSPRPISTLQRQRWLSYSRQLAIAALLIFLLAFVSFATPALLAFALLERQQAPKRRRLLSLVALTVMARGLCWLGHELRRHSFEPRGPWHGCEQCGIPISNKSRARYCSTGCRRLGWLRRAAAWDDRAAARLARLERPAPTYDPATAEIPF
jgi:hypothetical protein